MPLCPKCGADMKERSTDCHNCNAELLGIVAVGKKNYIKNILVFLLLWLIINLLFGWYYFVSGYKEGKDISHWQFLILNVSLLIMSLLPIVMLVIKKKKVAILIITFIVVPLIGYGSLYTVKQYYGNYTSEKWQNHVESRYLMITDMLKKNNLLSKNSKEIQRLLGQDELRVPARFLDTGNINKEYINRSYYVIHDTSWLGVVKEYLIIYYDDNGYVQKYEKKIYTE